MLKLGTVSPDLLIKLAHGYEQVSKHRASPKSTPALAGDVIPF